ncbi:MAG: DUF2339 domain-containing protein [Hyphomicrobium sp.]
MLSAIVAVIALVVAYRAKTASSALQLRLGELEAGIGALRDEIGWIRKSGLATGQPPAPDAKPDAAPVAPPRPAQAPPLPATPGWVPQVGRAVAPVATPPPTQQAKSRESFEQTLGTQWAVWAGGLALALGGLFLVRYSIEAGLVGPGVRVIMGLLLAGGLITAGEWFRRTETQIPIEALPQAHIPSILTAAGTVVAFGTIYAAHALYGFIGPALAFIALGATGIAAMLAAAIHGPALAGLGLAGAYIAPLLVQSNVPNPWPVVLYLAVVAAAAYLLARTRRWLWLAAAAVTGAFVWGGVLLDISLGIGSDGVTAVAVHTILQLALACGFLALEPHFGTADAKSEPDLIATAALAALTLLALAVISAPQFGLAGITLFATIAIALLGATAWMAAPAAAAAILGGVIALGVLLVWPSLSLAPDANDFAPMTERVLRLPDNITSFMMFAALATLIPAAGAALRIWRGSLLKERTAALYGLAATVPPLLALIIAYMRVTQFDVSIPFALGGAALAAGFAFTSERFHRADLSYSSPAYNLAAGVFAAAAIAALAFALTACLERGYLTVALALTALGTAYVATLRDIPLLRHAVTALGLVVLGRVAWNPRIMGSDVGATPIFNWLLLGYGVPAVSFFYAARMIEKRGDSLSVRLSDSLAVIFAGLLAFFEVRHLTNNGDVFHAGSGHVEAGLMVLVTLGLSYALARFHLRRANPVFDIASTIFGAASIAFAAFGLVLSVNPLFAGDAIGGSTIFSSLMPAYLLPGIAALFVARHTRTLRPEWYVRAAGALGVILIVMYVSLEVRHAFQGPLIALRFHDTSAAEHWAHSFAWLILGIAFLGYGLIRQSLEARIASAALIVLAALKITLFDLAGIGGIWRALSFICLGAVLIGIGLVYQKIVFAPPIRPQSE